MTAASAASVTTGKGLLAKLRGQGLRLSVRFDGLLLVGPQASITAEQDRDIRDGKQLLLDALAEEQRMRADVMPRIREMAERWQYSEEELQEALAVAANDPGPWMQYCELDEEAAGKAEQVGRRYPW